MKDSGILMTPELAEQARKGLKTVTRRLRGLKHVNQHPDDYYGCAYMANGMSRLIGHTYISDVINPYGVTGDRLYLREKLTQYAGYAIYEDGTAVEPRLKWAWKKHYLSPIHMPKAAARLWLRRTSNRPPERLQAITRSDIRAEGLVCPKELGSDDLEYNYKNYYIDEWIKLWDSINTKPSTRWEDNPWVWPVEFERIENEDK